MSLRLGPRARAAAGLLAALLLWLTPAAKAWAFPHAVRPPDTVRGATPPRGAPCDVPWQDGRGEVKDLIRCLVDEWSVDGGAKKAIEVARCESGLSPDAWNAHGCADYGCAGLFQAHMRYWHDWWKRWVKEFGLPDDPFDARSNAIWAVRSAHASGWDSWDGCV